LELLQLGWEQDHIIDSHKLETAFRSQDNAEKFNKNIGFVKLMKMKVTKCGNLHYQRQSRLQLHFLLMYQPYAPQIFSIIGI
jgi:ABC-type branched-subunit amino acid transport system ATPase component